MKAKYILIIALSFVMASASMAKKKASKVSYFPDGKTVLTSWFTDTTKVDVNKLGKKYLITDFGVKQDSTIIQTKEIQNVIDQCSKDGGGVIIVPKGTFLSGALFFKKGTHLHFEDGGCIKGIDNIKYYPLIDMHMEGLPVKYFAALVTAQNNDGFTITGHGTINGNAKRFWEEFWIRRQWNRKCTNLEALRPQLVYIAHSNDVTVQDVRIINSAFWSNHLYRCDRVRYLNCYIESPTKDQGEIHAPSSDGLDLDDCDDFVVRGCYINVCDDGVCMKGGRGMYVDKDSTAGPVNNVLVEKCTFGPFTNAGITCGSDAYDCSNLIMRDCRFNNSHHVLLFKMRTDTPQSYRNVLVERASGTVRTAFEVSSWKQFETLEKRPDMPVSQVDNVTLRDIDVNATDKGFLIRKQHEFNISNIKLENVKVNGKLIDEWK